jgi:hypothetical protein
MKPILSRKVTRGDVLNEWESSEKQATLDGLSAFAERQRQRMKDAQSRKSDAAVLALRDRIQRRGQS